MHGCQAGSKYHASCRLANVIFASTILIGLLWVANFLLEFIPVWITSHLEPSVAGYSNKVGSINMCVLLPILAVTFAHVKLILRCVLLVQHTPPLQADGSVMLFCLVCYFSHCVLAVSPLFIVRRAIMLQL